MMHALLYYMCGRGLLKVGEVFSCDDLILEVAQKHALDADCHFLFNLLAADP